MKLFQSILQFVWEMDGFALALIYFLMFKQMIKRVGVSTISFLRKRDMQPTFRGSFALFKSIGQIGMEIIFLMKRDNNL